MSLLHLPVSFALCIGSQSYGDCILGCWRNCADYLEHGSTVRGIYYADLIRKVRVALKEKGQGKLRHGVLFHQDNAPAHTSSQALAAIRNVGFKLLPHLPYSPDVAPSNIYLFPKLEEFMKWCKFADDKLHGKWLTRRCKSKILLQRNPSFGETLDQVHFSWSLKETMLKTDKIWCGYLMVNCVRLRTFWTPLVCAILDILLDRLRAQSVYFYSKNIVTVFI